MARKYNISKPKKYFDKNTNEEKTYWQNVGTMTEFDKQDGSVSRIIEIPAIGLEANVFPINRDESYQGGKQTSPKANAKTEDGEEEINIDDIPF